MSKDIHTPREELICGSIDRAEDIARDHSLVYLLDELARIRNHAERMEAKLVSRKQEAEHHELYVQALKSELAAIKAGQGEAVAYAYEYGKDNGDGSFSVTITRGQIPSYLTPVKDWPIKPLYTAPPATGVIVPRELLESAIERIELNTHFPFGEPQTPRDAENRKATDELRALLAQSQEVKS